MRHLTSSRYYEHVHVDGRWPEENAYMDVGARRGKERRTCQEWDTGLFHYYKECHSWPTSSMGGTLEKRGYLAAFWTDRGCDWDRERRRWWGILRERLHVRHWSATVIGAYLFGRFAAYSPTTISSPSLPLTLLAYTLYIIFIHHHVRIPDSQRGGRRGAFPDA